MPWFKKKSAPAPPTPRNEKDLRSLLIDLSNDVADLAKWEKERSSHLQKQNQRLFYKIPPPDGHDGVYGWWETDCNSYVGMIDDLIRRIESYAHVRGKKGDHEAFAFLLKQVEAMKNLDKKQEKAQEKEG